MSICPIWTIDETLSSAATPDKSGPWNNGNEVVVRIPQSSSIIEASLSGYLVS